MIRTKTSVFKANLGKYLRAVRGGKQVVIQDRDTPVARLVPYADTGRASEVLIWRPKSPTAPRLGSVLLTGIRYRGTDSSALLQEDRRRR